MKHVTKKKFREYLNDLYKDSSNYVNGRYAQRKRAYGDYLYFHDREMFDIEFEQYKKDKVI